MRRDVFTALLGVFLVAASCFAAGSVLASGSSDFIAWATSRASECDSRWTDLVATTAADEHASPSDGTQALSVRWLIGDRGGSKTKLSHTIINSTDFVHHVGGDFQFLLGIAHKRGGAARGTSPLTSPADAQLVVPYSIRRPLNSAMQQKNFFHSMRDVSRPRLTAFGRMHKGEHMFNTTIARPASRVARPRIL